MNPDQLYTLAKLRAAELEGHARHSRAVAEHTPRTPWRALRARLRHSGRRDGVHVPARAHVERPGAVAGS